jgi:hypothetical protein
MDNCTLNSGAEINELCATHGTAIYSLPLHSPNQIQPLDLSAFGMTKWLMAQINRIEAVDIEAAHAAQVTNEFMPESSLLSIIEMFQSAGIVLWLGTEGKLYCRVWPERAQCLVVGFNLAERLVPTEDKGNDDERVLL